MIVGERCAANEQWRFQYDDGRRRTIKTALYRRIEDKRRHPEDKDHEYYYNEFEWLSAFEHFSRPMPCRVEFRIGWCAGVRRVTLHDATLTVSNDESPYFQSSPLPLPVAVPEACRLARIPAMGSQASPTAPAPPPPSCPLTGLPSASLLVRAGQRRF
ncbi:transcriptional enhancer factor TEF-4 [Trichinella spiralis]|uniref:transcriptional enhancer factor TEF-4 n=1 Tax=Trichinella spiralis TaxID=6334 RepID=UPI0001EFD72D|nr:transcriptional enhancer factor TEF-4 [Trichinella spiralis]